jgi:riboflavin biosynthesis pyrimidine reductase
MEFRQLLPKPAAVEETVLLGSLAREESSPDDRPFTMANFVMSVDGRATLDGRSGGLGDDGDHAIFIGLREQVDAVLVGTGTLRAENYGRVLSKPERRQRRVERGLSPEPLLATVTRSGDIPADIPLFAEPEARIVVFSAATPDVGHCAAQVEVVSLDAAELTLTTVVRHLRNLHAVRTLLCEGGPTIFGALLQEHLVDDLFLTVAPKLAGGGRGPAITSGPPLAEPAQARIVWMLERDESLYLRYALR